MALEPGRLSTSQRIFEVTDSYGDRLAVNQYSGPDGFGIYAVEKQAIVGVELTVDQARSLAKVLTDATSTAVEEPTELTTTSEQSDRAWALQEARERFPHESPAAVLAVADWILNPDLIRDAVGTTDED